MARTPTFCLLTLCLLTMHGEQSVLGNILDVTCVNFNPIYSGSFPSFAAILSGADVTSSISFRRTTNLNDGSKETTWCSLGGDVTECSLPSGSTITSFLGSSGILTLGSNDQENFGVYGCRADRYNWTTEATTLFIRDNADFQPAAFTMTVSLDEEITLVMNDMSTGSGNLKWTLNREDGQQTDFTSDVLSPHELYISRASKALHAGVHHYYYDGDFNKGGLIRLIVRECLDNLWGPDCQYTCPTCYNGGMCDDQSGRCICPPGFTGDHCGTACAVGSFGKDCSVSCSSLESPGRNDCSGLVFCLPDPYGCSCAAGWTGLTCDQACSGGSYGAGCSQTCHCSNNANCDAAMGTCPNDCDDRWAGDQCQVRIVDMVGFNGAGGIDDVNVKFYIGVYINEDRDDPSVRAYVGREVDTGAGETGHGAKRTDGTTTSNWIDTGLPPGSTFSWQVAGPIAQTLRVNLFRTQGGDARVGAFRMWIEYKGRNEQTVMLNEYREDSSSEVWPARLSTTVGTGETAALVVYVSTSVDTANLRWRQNGGPEIIEWSGRTTITISETRKSDAGIYECYVHGNRDQGKHAIIRLIVRGCPSSKFGLDCSQDCPVCYVGGVCHDVTGECLCRPGYTGSDCGTPCPDPNNAWGRECQAYCSSSGGSCAGRLFSLPDPVGLSCVPGSSGTRCGDSCDSDHFGADCEFDCNCAGTCDSQTGCPSDLCDAEHEGTLCQDLASGQACPPGFYGTLCSYPCHCQNGESCDQTTGQCASGCMDGWAGTDCQLALPRLKDSPWVYDVTNDSIILVWDAWRDGYDYGNGPVPSYKIYYTLAGEGAEEVITVNESTAVISGLSAFTVYDVTLSAERDVGGSVVAGVTSESISVRTACGNPLLAPVIESVVVNGVSSVTLQWKLPETPSSSWLQCEASSYSYSLSYMPVTESSNQTTIPVHPVDGDGTVSKEVTGLAPCTEYLFSVAVVNSASVSGPANETTATTETEAPDPVDEIAFEQDSPENLTVSWAAPPAPQCSPLSYNITRRLLLRDQCDDTSSEDLASDSTSQTSYAYDDIYAYSTYEITVLSSVGDLAANDSAVSETNTTHAVPSEPPQNVTSDNSTKHQLTFTWDMPPCGSRNGQIFYSYVLKEAPIDKSEDRITYNNTSIEGFVEFSELPHYTTFTFDVCAWTDAGQGPCVDSIDARTLPSEPGVPSIQEDKSGAVNQTYGVVSWTEPNEINGILLRYVITKGSEEFEVSEDLQMNMSYAFADLDPAKSYNICIRAVSNGGDGDDVMYTLTTLPIPLPVAPAAPSTISTTQTTIDCTWEAPDETELGRYKITTYNIRVNGTSTPTELQPDSILTYTVENLNADSVYVIEVQAVNEGGEGEWSDSLREVTEPDPPPTNTGLIVGAAVGGCFLLLIILAFGLVFYKKRRTSPPPLPAPTYNMKDVESKDNEKGLSNPADVEETPTHTQTETRPRPPNYQPILISNLAKFVKTKKLEGFREEYRDLRNQIEEGSLASILENKPKNRYKNVITFDQHRVKLNRELTSAGADYINATYMDGYKKQHAFIASQGPNTASLDAFWQMVYEQGCATIVMLTNLVENGKVKCLEYWPGPEGSTSYEDIIVEGMGTKVYSSYTVRRFKVGKFGESPLEVTQFHYTIWPDMSVPESAQPLLDFRDTVKSSNPADAGPIIVHCSAGAGRTGTYITLDVMMDMIVAEKKIDVFNFVNKMRERRSFMVQVQAQYEFLFETLLQWTVCKQVSFPVVDLQKIVPQWKKADAKSGKSELAKQYELLGILTPKKTPKADERGDKPENVDKNRFPDKVPVDSFQPLLMTEGDYAEANDYINASFFDGAGEKNAHVCTQCPLPSTTSDFWRLVWDYNLNTIVQLNEMDSTCGEYWPDHDRTTIGSFTIELLSHNKFSDTMSERVFKLTTTKKKGERQITHYQFRGWPNSSMVPTSKVEFFDLLMQVDSKVDHSNNGKLLVVCMDGIGASATYLAAMETVKKVKQDKTVDVFTAVKRLRKSRPGAVESLEQYEFCFEVVAVFLDSVQTYANFM